MKSNVKQDRKRLVRLSLVLLGTCVLAATVLGTGAYSQALLQTERSEQDSLLVDRLIQARQANLLLHCLTRGKDTQARQMLSATVADNLQQAKALTQNATPGAVAEALCAIRILERDERAHPELYAEFKSGIQAPQIIQVARHEVKH